jgi:hypothetical protein
MNKRRLLTAVILATLPLLAQAPPTSSGPTLAETIDWLSGRVGSAGQTQIESGPFPHHTVIVGDHKLSFLGCRATLTRTSKDVYPAPMTQVDVDSMVVQFALSDVSRTVGIKQAETSPNWSSSPRWDVSLKSPGSAKPFTYQSTSNHSASRSFSLDYLDISFTDEDLANRFAKAFSRAIELCGGKADPF